MTNQSHLGRKAADTLYRNHFGAFVYAAFEVVTLAEGMKSVAPSRSRQTRAWSGTLREPTVGSIGNDLAAKWSSSRLRDSFPRLGRRPGYRGCRAPASSR